MAWKYPYNSDEPVYKPTPLQENRSAWKYVLLCIVTLGLYNLFFFIPFSFDLDKVCPRRDGTRTMNYLAAYILSYFTFSIVLLIWDYSIAERIQTALSERGIACDFGTKTFWLWRVLLGLFGIGNIVYVWHLCRAMNLLCADYNREHGIG